MIKSIIPLTLLGFALCLHVAPATKAADLTLNAESTGKAPCFAVSGEIDQTGYAPVLSGAISGDIEGTVTTVFGYPVVVHGVAVFRPVVQTWAVTGGIVEPLIGTTLTFEVDFLGILAKYPLIAIHNTARVVEGAQKGNLTLHGWTDQSAAPFLANHLDYHGVICP